MMHKISILVAFFGLLFAACSKESAYEGTWKNSDNATLEFRDDTTAIMGQEGIDGDVQGTYWTSGDTLWVKSGQEPGTTEEVYNLFTFYHRNDSLQLLEIALFRPSDRQTLTGSELARRLGKRTEDMAFVKQVEGQ